MRRRRSRSTSKPGPRPGSSSRYRDVSMLRPPRGSSDGFASPVTASRPVRARKQRKPRNGRNISHFSQSSSKLLEMFLEIAGLGLLESGASAASQSQARRNTAPHITQSDKKREPDKKIGQIDGPNFRCTFRNFDVPSLGRASGGEARADPWRRAAANLASQVAGDASPLPEDQFFARETGLIKE